MKSPEFQKKFEECVVIAAKEFATDGGYSYVTEVMGKIAKEDPTLDKDEANIVIASVFMLLLQEYGSLTEQLEHMTGIKLVEMDGILS